MLKDNTEKIDNSFLKIKDKLSSRVLDALFHNKNKFYYSLKNDIVFIEKKCFTTEELQELNKFLALEEEEKKIFNDKVIVFNKLGTNFLEYLYSLSFSNIILENFKYLNDSILRNNSKIKNKEKDSREYKLLQKIEELNQLDIVKLDDVEKEIEIFNIKKKELEKELDETILASVDACSGLY